MRIQNIQFTPNIKFSQNTSYHTKPYNNDSVSFCSKNNEDAKYKRAQSYANKMKFANIVWPFALQDYDMKKIEGIQSGISIFEGLSMPEIAFMFENLRAIAVKRGCSNQCLHCYADAKPALNNHDNFVSRMPFEDFLDLTSGIKTLKQRLGISPIRYQSQGYTDLFYDADCMEISLFDKNGKEHDFTELQDILYDSVKSKAVFDTAGWNPNSSKMQERAEKYVRYLNDLENEDKIYQINLSISPFNPIYAKAIELGFEPKNYDVKNQPWHSENSGKKLSQGELLYNIYINRMANMLMTFSPLLGDKKFSVIARPIDNFEKNMKYHTENDYFVIKKHIIETLKAKMLQDLAGEQKYVKSMSHVDYCIFNYSTLLNKTDTDLIMSGRFEKLYKSKNPNATQEYIDEMFVPISEFRENFETLKETGDLRSPLKKFLKVINTDGKLYLYDGYRFVPTEVGLNIGTKDKTTPPLSPEPEDFTITKKMIKKKYKKEQA